MQIKKAIDTIQGLRFVVDKLEVKSGLGRQRIYAQKFVSDKKALYTEYDNIEKCIAILKDYSGAKTILKICDKLSQILDISGSVNNLSGSIVLNDVELFEIKRFAILAENIKSLSLEINIANIPDLIDVIDILDPEKTRVPSFYIYDSYSEELTELRKKIKLNNSDAELFQKSIEIEDEIRTNLAAELKKHCKLLNLALENIAYLDFLIAKSKQALAMKFCKPKLSDEKTIYKKFFYPELLETLTAQGKKFQYIDIDFCNSPTLITGINMGGKTVLLKTLALSQTLCQFGFYAPASFAQIMPVDNIIVSIDNEQNHLQGLSSFAAEMLKVNEILNEIEHEKKMLVLIDELARTTNPTEGSAIVSAMLDILKENNVCAFVTSHYDKIDSQCRRLRVSGLSDNAELINGKNIEKYIDYSLVQVSENDVPHEALRIAKMLGVDEKLINLAIDKLKK